MLTFFVRKAVATALPVAAALLFAGPAAAQYAHFADQHRDMCAFYTLIAFAAGLHLGVVVYQTVRQRNERAGRDDAAPISTLSPIPNAKRIEYYDDRGMLYRVEWELLDLDGQIQNIEPRPDANTPNGHLRLAA